MKSHKDIGKLQEVTRVLAAHSENKEENVKLVEALIAAINNDNEKGAV